MPTLPAHPNLGSIVRCLIARLLSRSRKAEAGSESLALRVKAIVGGPTAKCFNTNFALIYDEIAKQRVAPTSVFAADPDARAVAEQLIRDAGFDPLHVGGLDNAATLEAHIAFTMMLGRGVSPQRAGRSRKYPQAGRPAHAAGGRPLLQALTTIPA